MEVYTNGKVLVLDDYSTLHVVGSALKGWKASVQDKGHLEELRVFASSIHENVISPIPLNDLVETSKTSIIVGGNIK